MDMIKKNNVLIALAFVLSCMIFMSCGGKKEISKKVIDKDVTKAMDMSLDSFINDRISWIKTSNDIVDIIIKEKKFDTDKPIDPSTGERPVVSIKDINLTLSGSDSLSVNSESSGKYTKDVSGDIREKVNIDIEDEVTKKESSWPLAIIFVSSLIILVLVIYLLKRFGVIS